MSPPGSPALADFVAQSPIDRRLILAWTRQAADLAPPGTRVLDAGAGDAPYAPLFAHCDYVSSDWEQSVHPGSAHATIVASLTDLPVPDAAFDLVVCTQVLEHIADPAAVLAELARVLAPDGELWLTVPFVGELHEEPHDYYRYTRHALAALVHEAGFTHVTVRPLGGYFSALAFLGRNGAAATGVELGALTPARLFTGIVRVMTAWLPWLDRFDRRRALPLGYGVRASFSSRA